MAPLLELPIEILEIIIRYVELASVAPRALLSPGQPFDGPTTSNHLTHPELYSLSLVCKDLRDRVEPYLYRTVIWNGESRMGTGRMCRLLDTMRARPSLARHVRHFQSSFSHQHAQARFPGGTKLAGSSVIGTVRAFAAKEGGRAASKPRTSLSWSDELRAAAMIELAMTLFGSLQSLVLMREKAAIIDAVFEAEFPHITRPFYQPLRMTMLKSVMLNREEDVTAGYLTRSRDFIDFRVLEILLQLPSVEDITISGMGNGTLQGPEPLPKATMLKHLQLWNSSMEAPSLAEVLECCPKLRTLRYDRLRPTFGTDDEAPHVPNANAFDYEALQRALLHVKHTLESLHVWIDTSDTLPSGHHVRETAPLCLQQFAKLKHLLIPWHLLLGEDASTEPPLNDLLPPTIVSVQFLRKDAHRWRNAPEIEDAVLCHKRLMGYVGALPTCAPNLQYVGVCTGFEDDRGDRYAKLKGQVKERKEARETHARAVEGSSCSAELVEPQTPEPLPSCYIITSASLINGQHHLAIPADRDRWMWSMKQKKEMKEACQLDGVICDLYGSY